MSFRINFRSLIPVIAVVLVLVVVSSCTQTKKYGCPNHLYTPTITIK